MGHETSWNAPAVGNAKTSSHCDAESGHALPNGRRHAECQCKFGRPLVPNVQQRGLRGLRPKLNAGRSCRLSEVQKEKLKRILLKGSQAAGYSTDLWTLKRVGEVIRKHFGIRYRSTHVWHVMSAGLGWGWQKPERRAIQRDEEAIARWKKTT